ncbi:MAG: hypothetical protein JW909_08445 [Planctomycetes bacterium]|nr:hypothetical protein [Planctomycetota bacterium]
MPMTSRERVNLAFHHQEPDRVPLNYIANPGIDSRLRKFLGVSDAESLLQALSVDFRNVGAPYVGPVLHPDVDDRKVDIWGIHRRWVEHESGGYWDYCDFPLKNASLDEIEAWPMPDPDLFDYSRVTSACRSMGDYAVVAGSAGFGDIINSTGMIRTMEQTLVDLVTDDPAGIRYVDRRTDIMVEITRRTLEAGEGRIDVFWLGEDLGTQNSQMISLDLFRRHIRPRMQKFVDVARHFDVPVMMHSCGSSSWAFEDFIDMGISIVDTLQPEAKDMSPAFLKTTFGGRLAFHGAISTAGAVAVGTADDVRSVVRDTLDIMMPGGGYALAPTHALQDNSPADNVAAMYEAALFYGVY